ncbi:MAG: hypothetical protein KO206_00175 [Methanomicrobiaceae archaeon]|nr:hypothetical protein [Methanomicrobiaceae archaeon]
MLVWLAAIKALQLALQPALLHTFGRLSGAVSYPASILLFTAASWYCGLIGLPLRLALLPFAGLLGYAVYTRFYTAERLRSGAVWDLAFLLPFLFMLEVRYINPTITYAEKFMDHAFIASIMRCPVVPPLDPWFAGGGLNVYYYLGHWTMGSLGVVTGVASPVVFNLALPTVLGLAAVSLYALGCLLLKRRRWLPVAGLFLINPSVLYLILRGNGWFDVLWGSTRTIENTIHEYPLFSMLWGDPHSHVISIFNQAFFIFLLAFALVRWGSLSGRDRWIVSGLAALSLGSMPGMNTWDVLVYAPAAVVFGLLIWRTHWQSTTDRAAWTPLLAVPPLSVALFLPYYLQLQSQGIEGIGIVHTSSNPAEFLLVHGFFLAVLLGYTARDIVRRPLLLLAALPFALLGYVAAALAAVPLVYLAARRRITAPGMFAILGCAIIILTEVLYLKDNMGEVYFRMNTVFKFYLPAWLLLGSATLVLIGRWLEAVREGCLLPERYGRALQVVAVAALLVTPFALNIDFGYGSRTLDGLAYLEDQHPGDAAAVAFLRELDGPERIVEAEGGDYTYYSRVSSFTGIPAIIGMPFHEHMWRGGDARVGERSADVRTIYEDSSRTAELMRKYGATLLYVGDAERERYRVQIPADAFELVYDDLGVQIYRLPA